MADDDNKIIITLDADTSEADAKIKASLDKASVDISNTTSTTSAGPEIHQPLAPDDFAKKYASTDDNESASTDEQDQTAADLITQPIVEAVDKISDPIRDFLDTVNNTKIAGASKQDSDEDAGVDAINSSIETASSASDTSDQDALDSVKKLVTETTDKIKGSIKPSSEKPEKDSNSKRPPNLEQEVLGETNKEIGLSAEAVRLFREALHVLHPALGEADIGLGELTGLLRASTGGVIALAAAIGGLLVAAIEKATDASESASQRIGTFLEKSDGPSGSGGIEAGRETVEKLGGVAQQLQLGPTDLVGPFEQILRANQDLPKQLQSSNEQLINGLKNIISGGVQEQTDPQKALSAITEFLKSSREHNGPTPADFDKLAETIPKTTAALIRQIPPERRGNASTGDLNSAAINAGPEIAGVIEEASKSPLAIATAFDHLKASSERMSEAISGGNVIALGLENFSKLLDKITPLAKKIADQAGKFNKGADQFNEDYIRPVNDAIVNFANKNLTQGVPQGGGQTDLDKSITSTISAAPGALLDFANKNLMQGVTPETPNAKTSTSPDSIDVALNSGTIERTNTALGKFADGIERTLKSVNEIPNALHASSAIISKQQAENALKFEKRETESKIGKDEIAVQNADIHLEQAKISGLEAQKSIEESKLGPESAHENLDDANTNYTKTLSNFLKNRGVDTTDLERVSKQQDDLNALNRADTTRKRAEIEDKYSYLEPQKAELAGQQTETAIRSAEFEKSDTSLALTKDNANAPLSHELAQLRYADASLKAEEEIKKLNETQVNTLGKILDALVNNKQKDQNTHGLSSSNSDSDSVVNNNREQNQSRDSKSPTSSISTPSSQTFTDSTGTTRKLSGGTTSSDGGQSPQYYTDDQGNKVQLGPGVNPNSTPPTQPAPQEQSPAPIPLAPPPIRDTGGETSATGPRDDGGETRRPPAPPQEQTAPDGRKFHYDPVTGQIVYDDAPANGHAIGGHIRGPGTETSDSIPAMLSHNEFVQPAKATSHYGVDFMESVRSLKLPRFALGGLVGNVHMSMAPAPVRLAGGGRVEQSDSSSSERHMIDMRTDHGPVQGLRANDATLGQIKQAALMSASVRTGKAQSWNR